MWRLIKVRSHICARALQKTTIESDSSKVEVVGKNFCFFQISISLNTVVEMYVYPPTASCALSLTVDAFKRFFSSIQRHIDPVSMYTGFLRKKNTADDARFSPTAPTNMSAFLFKHPGEATSKCQVQRMRISRRFQRVHRLREQRVAVHKCSNYNHSNFLSFPNV